MGTFQEGQLGEVKAASWDAKRVWRASVARVPVAGSLSPRHGHAFELLPVDANAAALGEIYRRWHPSATNPSRYLRPVNETDRESKSFLRMGLLSSHGRRKIIRARAN